MKKYSQIATISLGAVLLTACASKSRDHQAALRDSIAKKDFMKAKEIISHGEFLSEENNKLLLTMEKGRTFFLAKDYFQALNEFNKARDLSEELFTVSISKKASSGLVNDNSDNYYGESYEKSMIRFYQSLTHHMLSLAGEYEAHQISQKDADGKVILKPIASKKLSNQEIHFHATAAKNVLLDWDSYLSTLKATTGGVATYKDDLLAKMYGAYIHQTAGSSADMQIARDLYKSAKTVLMRNYNIYKSFNTKYEDFRKKFSDLPNLTPAQLEQSFISKTKSYKELEGYIDNQISSLESGKANNVLFIIENGLIQPKVAKKFSIPLAQGNTGRQLASVGNDIVGFSQKVLSAAAGSVPSIYFELPEIPFAPVQNSAKIVLESLDGKKVLEQPLFIVGPMDEIANQALDEKITGIRIKTGSRVAAKHLAAITAAYGVYSQLKKNAPEMVAFAAASASYAAANKLIASSEQADLRSWSTLPQSFSLSSARMPAGEYKVSLVENGVITPLQNIQINAKRARNIVALQR